MRRIGLSILALTAFLALIVPAGSANAYAVQYCAQVPIVNGTPPWGFQTGAPISGPTGSYARGHGDIDLNTDYVSGFLCQVFRVRHQPDRLIVMTVEHRLASGSCGRGYGSWRVSRCGLRSLRAW